MLTRLVPLALATLCTLSLAGCDEADATSVKIKLKPDLSGTIRTSRLLIGDDTKPGIGGGGITWNARADLVAAAGSFANLGNVKVEDMTFASGSTPDGMSYVNVTLPRGHKARWPGALTPLSAESRRQTATQIDPDKGEKLGSVLKIEMELPGVAVAHGFTPQPVGVRESVDGATVMLLIPVDVATTDDDAIIWQVTWKPAPPAPARAK